MVLTPEMAERGRVLLAEYEQELREEQAVADALRLHADEHDRRIIGLEQQIIAYRARLEEP